MRIRTGARSVLVAVALLWLSGSFPSQRGTRLGAQSPQPLPTFRSGIDIVQLDVVVLDKNRKPVTGLTADDFTILEDGKRRPLAAFAPVTLPEWPAPDPTAPAPAAWTREVASDVSSNERPGDGRVVLIVLDRTIPMEQPTVAARKIAHAIVDALGPNDLATVVRTGNFKGEGYQQGFTADRSRLRRAIDAPYMGTTNPPDITEKGLVRPDWGTRLDCDIFCELEQLTTFVRALESETRRQKTMFLIASQLTINDITGKDEGRLSEYRGRLFDALSRSNVTVNVLDPVGLQTLSKTADAFPAPGNNGLPQRVGPNLQRQEELKVLPSYTGGQALVNTNAPEAAVPRLFDETRSYYLLAYQLADPKPDGKKRSIRVKVDRPDVTVRSRTGIVVVPAAAASSDEPAPGTAAGQATRDAFAKADIPLGLCLAPVFEADGSVAVSATVSLPVPSSAPSSEVPAGVAERYELVIRTFTDRAAAVSTLRQVVEIPDSVRLGGLAAFEHVARFPLGPGHYEVRVGASSAGSGQTGSVYGYVDVPDTRKNGLILSGVVLNAPPPRALGGDIDGDGRPTLKRIFTRSDTVAASFQVRRDPSRVNLELTVTVRDVHNGTVSVRGASRFGPERVLDVSEPLPLAGLAPGEYLLTVEAKDGATTEAREIRFAIR